MVSRAPTLRILSVCWPVGLATCHVLMPGSFPIINGLEADQLIQKPQSVLFIVRTR